MALFFQHRVIQTVDGNAHHGAAHQHAGLSLETAAKSIKFWMGVPMGTSKFLGSAMALPSTVTRLVVRGIPVFKYLDRKATEATFID